VPSFGELARAATATLAEAGVSSPQVDAMTLLSEAAGIDARLAAARGDHATEDVARAFDVLVSRRAAREPLQHILGRAHFRHLTLAVGPGVFVPRPETEAVAHVAIEAALALGPDPVQVVDLCAGSGAIGLSVAMEVPYAQVTLVEREAAAFAWLERNLHDQDHATRARVRAVRADAASAALPNDLGLVGGAHIVVSNPPYIPPRAVPRDVEVRDFDPDTALYGGGEDGLLVPRGVTANAAALLIPGGLFVMEHGDHQGAAVRDLAAAHGGFVDIATGQDLTGRDRMLVTRRRH
jgi:release factor glutamine methyltransferase